MTKLSRYRFLIDGQKQVRGFSIIILLLCLFVYGLGVKATATNPVISDPIARIYTKISIDSIKSLYDPLMHSGAYEDLITKQKKVIELSTKIYEANSPEIAEENHWLGYFLSQCGDYSKAILCIQTSAQIYDSLGSEYLGEYFDVLEKIALYNYLDNKIEDSLQGYTNILEEFNRKNAFVIEPYVEALSMSLRISQQYNIPISLEKPLEFLFSESQYIEDEDKLNLYGNVVNYYLNANNPNKAIEVYSIAKALVTQNPEFLVNEKWGDILLNVVNAYASLGHYDKAIERLEEAKEVYTMIDNPLNTYYVHYSLGNIRHQQSKMQQAFDAYEQAIKVADSIEGMTLEKANLFALQARCKLALNERDNAYALIEKGLSLIENEKLYATHEIIEIYDVFSTIACQKGLYNDVIKKLLKVKDSYVMNDLFEQQIDENIGLAYAKKGDFENAVLIADSLFKKLPEDQVLEKITNDRFEAYIARVITIGSIYSLSDKLSNALHLLNHAYEICEQRHFNSGEGFGALLNNLGLYNSYLGNYEDAKKFSHMSLGFNERNRNKGGIHSFETLSNLFLISLQTKDDVNLQHYAQLSYDAMKEIESLNFAEIETFIRNLLHYFVITDDLERAEALNSHIEFEAERIYGKNSQRYFEAISSAIYLYEAKKDWDSLISLAESILNSYDNNLHLRRAPIYYSLLNASMFKGDTEKTGRVLKETYSHEAEKVQMMAQNFDSQERLYLLDDIQNYLISRASAYLCENNLTATDKASFVETIYNSVLLFKGLNLQIDKNVNKGIESIGIDSMQDVQAHLSSEDCAIEFVEFDSEKGREYGALILTSTKCDFVTIDTEKNLLDTPVYDRYNNRGYSQKIWGNILPYISDKSNIYFSACGELHNIGIEYLLSQSVDGTISDQFNVYRLSSTRILIGDKCSNKTHNIALFGGMIYDEAPDAVSQGSQLSSKIPYNEDNIEALRGNNYKYLPATLKEVNLIDSIFNGCNLESSKFTGLSATESSFKAMGVHSPSILHIATHGIYWNVESAQHDTRWSSLFDSEMNVRKVNEEDYALARSVLLFSGAQKYLAGNMSVDNGEDGILTALELSKLRLDMVDLVVLSACQTGLGDVRGDGVFGLQRGLKKAGVNSILMSLWEVDDEATSLLMVEFYKNITNGISKKESLRMAQKKIRETQGFEDPDNWASFILLDGLN